MAGFMEGGDDLFFFILLHWLHDVRTLEAELKRSCRVFDIDVEIDVPRVLDVVIRGFVRVLENDSGARWHARLEEEAFQSFAQIFQDESIDRSALITEAEPLLND